MQLLDDEDDRPPQINVTPMIDVIFSILAFFVVATVFLSRSRGLPVNLPAAATGQPPETPPLVVSIAADGAIALGSSPPSPVTVAALPAAVRDRLGGRPSPLVVINADRAVSHGRVVEVMDTLRATLPGLKLAIATQERSP